MRQTWKLGFTIFRMEVMERVCSGAMLRDEGELPLARGLQKFFSTSGERTCLLEYDKPPLAPEQPRYLAIWMAEYAYLNGELDVAYYLLNGRPDSRFQEFSKGEAVSVEAACVLRFYYLEGLAELLLHYYTHGDLAVGRGTYHLHAVRLVEQRDQMNPEQIMDIQDRPSVSPPRNFIPTADCHPSAYLQSLGEYEPHIIARGSQAAWAVAAHALSFASDPNTWSGAEIDNVITVGYGLAMHQTIVEKDLLPPYYLPMLLENQFYMGCSNRFEVRFDTGCISGHKDNLRQLVYELFQRSRRGIVRRGEVRAVTEAIRIKSLQIIIRILLCINHIT